MKSFNTFCFFLCVSLFSLNATSANQQQTISKGQTKTITLNMAGAFTAKSVSVSGKGVTASIQRKYSDKIKIKLTTYNNTKPGLRDISVRLAAGVNKTPLYIFGIKKAKVNITGPGIAGKFQKVEVEFPAIAGKLEFSSHCTGSKEGSYAQHNVAKGYFPVKKVGDKRSVWISTPDNPSSSNHCNLTVVEYSIHSRRSPEIRNIRVNFARDNSMPRSIARVTTTTPNNETSTTSSTRGNSPLLRWNRVDNADKYTIRYKKYNPHLAIPNLPGTGHPSRATAQNSYRIPRLQPGHYVWCVLGSHSPPKQSVLKPTAGACSSKKTFIIQKT